MKKWNYWDGKILKGPDGRCYLFVDRWDQAKGHNDWPESKTVEAVSSTPLGPYVDQGLLWPDNQGGKGCNVTALEMPDHGGYAVVVSETRDGDIFTYRAITGPFTQLGTITVTGKANWHGSNVSLIARPDGGFEIIKLVDRRVGQGQAADAPKLVQTHVRRILLRVADGVSESAARQKLLEIKGDVEKGGDFANFARTYSQDGSASQGGDLGWISPGETVPEFERAMNNLKDGQVSDPVRSEYGYHLIQVLARRDAEGSVQQQLDTARQAIGQRKAEQAYSDWLRELRDTAYVQYKGVAAQQALNQ